MLRALTFSIRKFSAPKIVMRPCPRSFSVSSRVYLKEIREKQEGDTLIIEGVNVSSPRTNKLVKSNNEHGACSLCALDLDVKHTDVLIIKQFLDHNAKLYPRKITGLCRWQQRKMRYLIEMATRAGLINPLLPQPIAIPDYQRGWRKWNTYYDESEIPESTSERSIQKSMEFEEAYKLAKAEKDAHEAMLKKGRAMRKMKGSNIAQLG